MKEEYLPGRGHRLVQEEGHTVGLSVARKRRTVGEERTRCQGRLSNPPQTTVLMRSVNQLIRIINDKMNEK